MILSREAVLSYLDRIRSLQSVHPLTDIHVSPFEVIFNGFHYSQNPQLRGVYTLDDAAYSPPSPGAFRIMTDPLKHFDRKSQNVPSRLSVMLYRQCFAHIGPRVLQDHMMLSGVRRSLLLPVVQPDSDGEEQQRLMFEIYGGFQEFSFGYCIPNTVSNENLLSAIRKAITDHDVKAIKVHPNIQAIDLSAASGRQRVENILDACRLAALPLVIHGGISPALKDSKSRSYAVLRNLCPIEWSITPTPVIISHAGLMACGADEARDQIHLLHRILEKHGNVVVDISALEFDTLCLVLRQIDPDRIIFGSDAPYFAQWTAAVRLLYALERILSAPEAAFVKIAATNPSRHLSLQTHKDKPAYSGSVSA